jgi:hypothetical protein
VQEADLIALRPAVGLAPRQRAAIIGCVLTRTVDAGSPFLEADLSVKIETATGMKSGMAMAMGGDRAAH